MFTSLRMVGIQLGVSGAAPRHLLLGACRRAGAGGLLAAASVLTVPAAADEASRVGWWTRDVAATAPEGGFAIGDAPDGALSIAAIEINSPLAGQRVQLALGEVSSVGPVDLLACPTIDAWEAVGPGDMADAPSPACERASQRFTRDPASGQWVADVASLLDRSVASSSILVIPARPAAFGPVSMPLGGLATTAFRATFAPPVITVVGEPAQDGVVPPPSDSQLTPAPEVPADLAGSSPARPSGNPTSPSAAPSIGDVPAIVPGAVVAPAPTASASPVRAGPAVTRSVARLELSKAIALAALSLLAGTAAGGGRWLLRERLSRAPLARFARR